MSNKNSDFKPYIPADRVVPEFTVTSVLIGIVLAIVFGAANAYLGLKVGMTISASIPAAVISMGIIRVILRRDSILENNLVQTIGSAGESVAAGAIFTLPALFLWAKDGIIDMPSVVTLGLVALVGGVLGVIFMVPLRQALIVEEHGVLPFPEGTACAEVLLAGEEGGSKAGVVFSGLGIAAAYKLISDGFKVFPSEIGHDIAFYKGSSIGIQVLPALAGGTLSWFVIMPMIALFGGDAVVFPGSDPISTLAPSDLWGTYVKYIGAGAVATGGIISLIKSFPLIVRTFKQAMKGMKSAGKASTLRTEQDIPMPVLLIAMVAPVHAGPALLLGDVLAALHEPANHAAGHDAGAEAEGQVHTHGEGHHLDAHDLRHDGHTHAGKDQGPGQLGVHDAFHQHLHHGSLGSGDLAAAELPGGVHQIQHEADDGGGGDDADDLADLLLLGGSAQDEAGLQVLRAVACDGGDDADDAADADGAGHAGGAHGAGGFQKNGGDDNGGDGHAGHRVIGGTDEAHHPGGHGGKEEAEDHHDDCTQQVHGERRQQPDGHSDDHLYTSGLIAGEGLMGVVLAGLAAAKLNIDVSGILNLGGISSIISIIAFVLLLASLVKVCTSAKK